MTTLAQSAQEIREEVQEAVPYLSDEKFRQAVKVLRVLVGRDQTETSSFSQGFIIRLLKFIVLAQSACPDSSQMPGTE